MPARGYDNAPSEVRAALEEAARKTGVSSDVLQAIAGRESTFNPNAINPRSSAKGLGQFLDGTWSYLTKKYGAAHGISETTSRFDPRASALMMGEFTKENTAALQNTLGRTPTVGEAYAAYFMGAKGMANISHAYLNNPNADAASLFPREAAANPKIFNGKTVGQVYANLTSTGGGNAGAPVTGGASGLPNPFETEPEPVKHQWNLFKGYTEAAKLEQMQSIATQYVMQLGDDKLAPDPAFRWTPELIKQTTEGLPEKYGEWIVDHAHSAAHAQYLRKKAQDDIEANQDLSEYGFLGNMGLRAAAILTDIPSWLMGAGAGKVAMLGRAGLAARATSAGLIAVAENAPLMALKANAQPGYAMDDLLVDSAFAFSFGAAFGSAFGPAGDHLDARISGEAARINREVLEAQGHQLTDAGKAHYQAMENQGGALTPKGSPQRMTSGGSAGFDDGVVGATLLDRTDFSVNARLQKSHSSVRETAAGLDDALAGNGGATVRPQETAFEEMRRTHEAADAGVSRVVEQEFDAFAKEQGLPLYAKAGTARDHFEEAAGRQIYAPDPNADPHVARAAQAYAEGFGQWLDRAKAAGAKWAENIQRNDRYFPMMFDREKVRAYVDRVGEEGVVSVVRQALKAANRELEDGLAQRVAEKYVRTVQAATEGLEGSRATALSGLDKHGLVELLTEQGLDPEDAAAFVEAFKPVQKQGPKNFRQKTLLDDTTRFIPEGSVRERIEGHDGKLAGISRKAGEGDGFSVRDLTNQNAEEVWHMYNRSLAGHVAMTRQGFDSHGAFESHIRSITLGEANKKGGYTDAIANRDYKDLSYLGKSIYGIPVRDMSGPGAKLESIFGNLNFARFMGQSGIAQLSDMPKIMLKTSMAAAWNTFKIGDLARVLQRGGVDADILSRDLEVITGVGTQMARGKLVQKFKDIDSFYPDSKSATFLDRAVRMSKTGANVTALVSGMTPVNDFLQRWATRASLQHLADVVGGKVTRSERVLNDMGLGTDELARFKTLIDGMKLDGRGMVEDLRLAHLRKADAEGVDILGAYLSRQARTIIVETTPGNLPRWMGESAFRFMGQFRAFSFASHAANTVHNVKMGKAYAAQSFIVTGAWSGLVYAMHTYSKSIGRDDQEEYLQKNLDPVNLAFSAFGRSPDSGILPTVIDTALFPVYRATGWESPFSNARTTGLAAGIQGTPLVSLGIDLTEAVGQGAAALGGQKDFSRQDAQRIARIMPLNNTYGIANAIRAVAQEFPDRNP